MIISSNLGRFFLIPLFSFLKVSAYNLTIEASGPFERLIESRFTFTFASVCPSSILDVDFGDGDRRQFAIESLNSSLTFWKMYQNINLYQLSAYFNCNSSQILAVRRINVTESEFYHKLYLHLSIFQKLNITLQPKSSSCQSITKYSAIINRQ